jgi:hypothetical protein
MRTVIPVSPPEREGLAQSAIKEETILFHLLCRRLR